MTLTLWFNLEVNLSFVVHLNVLCVMSSMGCARPAQWMVSYDLFVLTNSFSNPKTREMRLTESPRAPKRIRFTRHWQVRIFCFIRAYRIRKFYFICHRDPAQRVNMTCGTFCELIFESCTQINAPMNFNVLLNRVWSLVCPPILTFETNIWLYDFYPHAHMIYDRSRWIAAVFVFAPQTILSIEKGLKR